MHTSAVDKHSGYMHKENALSATYLKGTACGSLSEFRIDESVDSLLTVAADLEGCRGEMATVSDGGIKTV